MGVVFPYEHCTKLKSDAAIDVLAEAWIGCQPLVDLAPLGCPVKARPRVYFDNAHG
jgi:hypothetical protein